MAATAIAAIGLGISAASAVGQYSATSRAVGASRRAEQLREQMMKAETLRRQRELTRQSILATSMTRARAVGQGVSLGSSAIYGAYGQTAGEVGRQGTALYENQALGSGIFDANRRMADAQGQAAMFNQLGQLGNFMMGYAQTITKVGGTLAANIFGGPPPTTQFSWDLGTSVSRYRPPTTFSIYGPTGIP